MSTALQKNIRDYIEEHRLPIAAFEREAGLKTNVLRNVLRGDTKRPTSDTLQTIAAYMKCTVSELLGEENRVKSFQEDLSPVLEDPQTLICSLEVTTQKAHERGPPLTVKQALSLAETVYKYALKKDPPHVDPDFVSWLLENE